MAAALLMDGGQADCHASDDKFIADLSSDSLRITVDRTTAITAGRSFCKEPTKATSRARSVPMPWGLVITGYGFESGPPCWAPRNGTSVQT